MKAVKIKKNGGPEVLDLEEITLRKPIKDEVLIEHAAIGLNYIDTYHRSGLYPLMMPSGLGMEASGVIKEVGPDVSNFSVGDRVAYSAIPLGAYSSHRIYKTKNLVKVPKEIDLNIAAAIMTKGLTTYYLLHKTYPVSGNKTILFHAASGALDPINVTKMLQPKGLYFVRPSMGQYLSTNQELSEAAKVLFEKISSGKVKIEIFKKYKLDDIKQAHIDLENRKIVGPDKKYDLF